MSNIFGSSLLYFVLESDLACSPLRYLLWPSILFATPRGSVMLDCGFSPLMSSLSDRNMRLGDVLLPPGIKQPCLYLRVQGSFTLRKVLLKQLSVALSLYFGWDLQLNTSEMFWIDISRWMIRSRCRWISVYLPWRTVHAFEPLPFFCSIVSIGCGFNPVNCPAVICLPRIAFLSSFGRETSVVNIMGPRSIFPPLFSPSIYFLLLL